MTPPDTEHHETEGCPDTVPEGPDTREAGEMQPRGMTLEGFVTMTGEMEHLNELVLLHVEKSGGFTCTASYLTLVTPILDMLECEIRFRYRDGMDSAEIKAIIAGWIDREIAGLQTPGK